MYKLLCYFILILALSSCSFFSIRKPLIQQGNIITTEMVSQLHKGMSPDQVKDIMGNPVLENLFTRDRMVYVYTYQRGTDPREEKQVELIFNQGRLVQINQ